MELIGWLGSLCFAVCALPQVIQTVKEKPEFQHTFTAFVL
jgi:uncharacterized protein with PQ loop repeat